MHAGTDLRLDLVYLQRLSLPTGTTRLDPVYLQRFVWASRSVVWVSRSGPPVSSSSGALSVIDLTIYAIPTDLPL